MSTTTHIPDWVEHGPGQWRSTDGRYLILCSARPGDIPSLATIYTLRKRGKDEVRAWGDNYLGYHLGEHFSLTEAQAHAHRDARADRAHGANVATLDALPALASAPFWWWISDGTTRGRLIVTREGGRVYARIVGMSCRTETEWVPGVAAEVDITDLTQGKPRTLRHLLSRWTP